MPLGRPFLGENVSPSLAASSEHVYDLPCSADSLHSFLMDSDVRMVCSFPHELLVNYWNYRCDFEGDVCLSSGARSFPGSLKSCRDIPPFEW